MDCVIEFYRPGVDRPAAIVQLAGQPEEQDGGREGVVQKLRLLSDMLHNLPEGPKTSDPEWAAAEYVTLFRKLADPTVKISVRRQPQANVVYKVNCTQSGLKTTVLQRSNGDSFKQVA